MEVALRASLGSQCSGDGRDVTVVEVDRLVECAAEGPGPLHMARGGTAEDTFGARARARGGAMRYSRRAGPAAHGAGGRDLAGDGSWHRPAAGARAADLPAGQGARRRAEPRRRNERGRPPCCPAALPRLHLRHARDRPPRRRRQPRPPRRGHTGVHGLDRRDAGGGGTPGRRRATAAAARGSGAGRAERSGRAVAAGAPRGGCPARGPARPRRRRGRRARPRLRAVGRARSAWDRRRGRARRGPGGGRGP